jgi:hypothetical protein
MWNFKKNIYKIQTIIPVSPGYYLYITRGPDQSSQVTCSPSSVSYTDTSYIINFELRDSTGTTVLTNQTGSNIVVTVEYSESTCTSSGTGTTDIIILPGESSKDMFNYSAQLVECGQSDCFSESYEATCIVSINPNINLVQNAYLDSCTNTVNDPVDCVVSDWSEYSSCENGTQSRTRTVITPAQNGGASCPVLTESRSCTVQTSNPVKWIGEEPYCEQETIE